MTTNASDFGWADWRFRKDMSALPGLRHAPTIGDLKPLAPFKGPQP